MSRYPRRSHDSNGAASCIVTNQPLLPRRSSSKETRGRRYDISYFRAFHLNARTFFPSLIAREPGLRARPPLFIFSKSDDLNLDQETDGLDEIRAGTRDIKKRDTRKQEIKPERSRS